MPNPNLDRRGRAPTRNDTPCAQPSNKGSSGVCATVPSRPVVKKPAPGSGTCENPNTRSSSMPARPPTRRNPYEVPPFSQAPTRAKSTGPGALLYGPNQCLIGGKNKTPSSSKLCIDKSIVQCTTSNSKVSLCASDPCTKAPKSQASCGLQPQQFCPTPAPRQKKLNSSFCAPDHEYLQFSLRITEDIIRNDLYTNKEMRRVFNSHIEANRGRLDLQKMREQIEKLSKELNIPLDEELDCECAQEQPSRHEIKRSRQALQSTLSCRCGPINRPLNAPSVECSCDSMRCLPFQCVQPPTCPGEMQQRSCSAANIKTAGGKCGASEATSKFSKTETCNAFAGRTSQCSQRKLSEPAIPKGCQPALPPCQQQNEKQSKRDECPNTSASLYQQMECGYRPQQNTCSGSPPVGKQGDCQFAQKKQDTCPSMTPVCRQLDCEFASKQQQGCGGGSPTYNQSGCKYGAQEATSICQQLECPNLPKAEVCAGTSAICQEMECKYMQQKEVCAGTSAICQEMECKYLPSKDVCPNTTYCQEMECKFLPPKEVCAGTSAICQQMDCKYLPSKEVCAGTSAICQEMECKYLPSKEVCAGTSAMCQEMECKYLQPKEVCAGTSAICQEMECKYLPPKEICTGTSIICQEMECKYLPSKEVCAGTSEICKEMECKYLVKEVCAGTSAICQEMECKYRPKEVCAGTSLICQQMDCKYLPKSEVCAGTSAICQEMECKYLPSKEVCAGTSAICQEMECKYLPKEVCAGTSAICQEMECKYLPKEVCAGTSPVCEEMECKYLPPKEVCAGTSAMCQEMECPYRSKEACAATSVIYRQMESKFPNKPEVCAGTSVVCQEMECKYKKEVCAGTSAICQQMECSYRPQPPDCRGAPKTNECPYRPQQNVCGGQQQQQQQQNTCGGEYSRRSSSPRQDVCGGQINKDPCGGQQNRDPCGGQQIKDPCPGQQSRDPCGGQQIKDPCGGQQNRDPCGGPPKRDPCPAQQNRDPCGGQQIKDPCPAQQNRDPCGGQQKKDPCGGSPKKTEFTCGPQPPKQDQGICGGGATLQMDNTCYSQQPKPKSDPCGGTAKQAATCSCRPQPPQQDVCGGPPQDECPGAPKPKDYRSQKQDVCGSQQKETCLGAAAKQQQDCPYQPQNVCGGGASTQVDCYCRPQTKQKCGSQQQDICGLGAATMQMQMQDCGGSPKKMDCSSQLQDLCGGGSPKPKDCSYKSKQQDVCGGGASQQQTGCQSWPQPKQDDCGGGYRFRPHPQDLCCEPPVNQQQECKIIIPTKDKACSGYKMSICEEFHCKNLQPKQEEKCPAMPTGCQDFASKPRGRQDSCQGGSPSVQFECNYQPPRKLDKCPATSGTCEMPVSKNECPGSAYQDYGCPCLQNGNRDCTCGAPFSSCPAEQNTKQSKCDGGYPPYNEYNQQDMGHGTSTSYRQYDCSYIQPSKDSCRGISPARQQSECQYLSKETGPSQVFQMEKSCCRSSHLKLESTSCSCQAEYKTIRPTQKSQQPRIICYNAGINPGIPFSSCRKPEPPLAVQDSDSDDEYSPRCDGEALCTCGLEPCRQDTCNISRQWVATHQHCDSSTDQFQHMRSASSIAELKKCLQEEVMQTLSDALTDLCTCDTLLKNQSSLGKLTECTEPTNSSMTVPSQSTVRSATSVSSFEQPDVLPGFECLEKSNKGNFMEDLFNSLPRNNEECCRGASKAVQCGGNALKCPRKQTKKCDQDTQTEKCKSVRTCIEKEAIDAFLSAGDSKSKCVNQLYKKESDISKERDSSLFYCACADLPSVLDVTSSDCVSRAADHKKSVCFATCVLNAVQEKSCAFPSEGRIAEDVCGCAAVGCTCATDTATDKSSAVAAGDGCTCDEKPKLQRNMETDCDCDVTQGCLCEETQCECEKIDGGDYCKCVETVKQQKSMVTEGEYEEENDGKKKEERSIETDCECDAKSNEVKEGVSEDFFKAQKSMQTTEAYGGKVEKGNNCEKEVKNTEVECSCADKSTCQLVETKVKRSMETEYECDKQLTNIDVNCKMEEKLKVQRSMVTECECEGKMDVPDCSCKQKEGKRKRESLGENETNEDCAGKKTKTKDADKREEKQKSQTSKGLVKKLKEKQKKCVCKGKDGKGKEGKCNCGCLEILKELESKNIECKCKEQLEAQTKVALEVYCGCLEKLKEMTNQLTCSCGDPSDKKNKCQCFEELEKEWIKKAAERLCCCLEKQKSCEEENNLQGGQSKQTLKQKSTDQLRQKSKEVIDQECEDACKTKSRVSLNDCCEVLKPNDNSSVIHPCRTSDFSEGGYTTDEDGDNKGFAESVVCSCTDIEGAHDGLSLPPLKDSVDKSALWTSEKSSEKGRSSSEKNRLYSSMSDASSLAESPCTRERLLLGDKYKVCSAPDTRYSSGMPVNISQFFPNVCTQTCSEDFLGDGERPVETVDECSITEDIPCTDKEASVNFQDPSEQSKLSEPVADRDGEIEKAEMTKSISYGTTWTAFSQANTTKSSVSTPTVASEVMQFLTEVSSKQDDPGSNDTFGEEEEEEKSHPPVRITSPPIKEKHQSGKKIAEFDELPEIHTPSLTSIESNTYVKCCKFKKCKRKPNERKKDDSKSNEPVVPPSSHGEGLDKDPTVLHSSDSSSSGSIEIPDHIKTLAKINTDSEIRPAKLGSRSGISWDRYY